MQSLTLALLIGMTVLLLGCGLFSDGRTTEGREASSMSTVAVDVRSPFYEGPRSLESRIIASPVIVRVRLGSVSTSVESGPTYRGVKYSVLLEFNFSVLEYLKGSGADDIVAVWAAAPFFETSQEAEAALPAITAAREADWDDHDAIVFLRSSNASLASTQQANRYYLAWGGSWMDYGVDDDGYSLGSRHDKLWLPAESASSMQSQSGGDRQRFLMDVPPDSGTQPMVTLGELKARIAAVTARLDAGDGSEQYRECLERTYRYEGQDRYRTSIGDEVLFTAPPDGELASGLGASSVVHEAIAYTDASNVRLEVWLEGTDADLSSVEFGEAVPSDFSGADGNRDLFEFAYRVVSARPLPADTYTVEYNLRDAHFVRCEGYTYHHEWAITVNAPDGTLHEAFFDPVTDGTAVAADGTNGVLKPASFTGTDRATATVERIEWESGTVKLELSSDDALAGHVVDFIELDGTVSLSLHADQATVDAANDTLSWSVASQPWHDGDELMLRVGRGPCWNNTAVPNPADNPGLMRDCFNLLAAKDALRGTATLNWSVDTAISDWDGVKVEGSPARVTELNLSSSDLTGTIPPDLGRLDGLVFLRLVNNQLTGEIPAELGSLSNLRIILASDNRLTGAIPPELGGLSSLEELWLHRNRLSGEIPAALGDLGSLRKLTLAGNRLSGAIPSDLGDLSNLEDLWLNYNQLTGEIPAALGNLSNLQRLLLGNNQLTGEIPAALGDLSNLQRLLLGNNQLTGCIPPALQNVDDNDLDTLGLQDCAAP